MGSSQSGFRTVDRLRRTPRIPGWGRVVSPVRRWPLSPSWEGEARVLPHSGGSPHLPRLKRLAGSGGGCLGPRVGWGGWVGGGLASSQAIPRSARLILYRGGKDGSVGGVGLGRPTRDRSQTTDTDPSPARSTRGNPPIQPTPSNSQSSLPCSAGPCHPAPPFPCLTPPSGPPHIPRRGHPGGGVGWGVAN